VTVRDIVAVGRSEELGHFAVILDDSTHAPTLDSTLLKASFKGWTLSPPIQVNSNAAFPTACLAKGMLLAFDMKSHQLSTGMYGVTLNGSWFALIQVKDRENVYLSIAPHAFSFICDRIAKANVKSVPIKSVSPPPRLTARSNTLPLVQLRTANSFTDNTISLAGWTASQDSNTYSSPRPSDRHKAGSEQHKEENKNMLKKLLLLSLRHVGVEKSHPEFMSIWKHLYCGCVFALRRELAHDSVPQSTMLAVIKNNMNFLNVSR